MTQKAKFEFFDSSLETAIKPREESQVQISIIVDELLDITVRDIS